MTRFVIEEPCPTHPESDWPHQTMPGQEPCPGFKRTVFEGVPDELVERGAKALRDRNFGGSYWPDDPAQQATWLDQARAVLEAVFGKPEK